MSVNSELSALLTKMGGTPLESDSNSDLIKKISNAYEGGGESSGGGVIMLHIVDDKITIDGVETNIQRLDKTYDEITTAFMAGTQVLYGEEDYIMTGVNALSNAIVIFEYDDTEGTVSCKKYNVTEDCLYPYYEQGGLI